MRWWPRRHRPAADVLLWRDERWRAANGYPPIGAGPAECIASDFRRASVALVAEVVNGDELTPGQGAQLFDAHARHILGISGAEFLRLWDSGELRHDSGYGVTSVAMLIPFAREVRSETP